jgi:hypothetical protein
MIFLAFIGANLIVGAAGFFIGFAAGARAGIEATPERDTLPSIDIEVSQ